MADQTIPSIKNLRGKIGIGLISPSTPLHVKGNIRAEASGSTSFADFKSSQIWAGSTYDIIVGTNNPLYFRTNDTKRMTILGGGNVGIGTTSPAAKLDIVDSQTQSGSTATATIKSTATTTATSTQSSAMYAIQNNLTLTGTGGSFQNSLHQQVMTTVSSTGTATNLKNHMSRVHTSGSGQINNVAHYNIHTELDGNGTINKWMGYAVADGIMSSFTNTGHTITDTYGLYIGDLTSGTQTNTPFGVYQLNTDMKNYFGGSVGIGVLPNSPNKLEIDGGDLLVNTASGSIQIDESANTLKLSDDHYIVVGNGGDLQIYHEATGENSYIDNSTGDLFIRNNSNDSVIIGHNANKGLLYVPDGRVELRFNDSKTFETIADGAKVTGSLGVNTTPHTNQQLHIVASSTDTTGLEFSASQHSNESRILSYDRGSGGGYRPFRIQGSELKFETSGVQQLSISSLAATFSGNVVISGGLTVQGETTTINSTIVSVDDKNIELGSVATPTDLTADGGGITLKGASDYKIEWFNSNDSWNFNQGIVVGQDGQGHDVTFHSTTSGRALQWDASAKALKLDDLTTFAVGSSDDLQFYHNTHSYIESITNHLYINNNAADGKTVFKADDGGGSAQTEFFRIDGGGGTNVFSKPLHVGVDDTGHDVKFFGATTGFYLHWDESANALTGYYDLKLANEREIQLGATNDLRLYHSSGNNFIKANSGDLTIQSDNDDLKLLAQDDIVLRDNDDSTNFIHCVNGGPVRLYHNGSQRLETTASGVTISGLSLELFHSGGNNYISSAASGSHLLIRNTGGANVELLVNTSEKGVIAKPNGAVELYHDNALKLSTTSAGASVSGGLFISGNYTDTGNQLNIWCDSNGHGNVAVYDFTLKTGSNNSRTNIFKIDTNGKVGIGTASPDTPLEIEVPSAANTQTRCFHIDHNPTGNTGSGYMTIRSGTNTGASASLEQVSSGGGSLYGTYADTNLINHGTQTSGAYNNINFVTNDAIRMTVGGGSQAGKVGIGTTTPSRTLHVVDSAGPTIKFERNSNSNLEFTFGTANTSIIGSGEIQFRANGGTSNKFIINNSQILSNAKLIVNTSSGMEVVSAGTSGGGLIRLKSTGETSAGNTVGKIEFYNSDTTDHTAGVMASIKAIAGPSGGEGHLQFLTDMPSSGAEANQVALHLHSDANVGIANTNPSALHSDARNLVVGSGSGNQGITIYGGSSNSSNLYFADGTTGDQAHRGYVVYNHDSEKLFLGAGGGTHLTLTNGSNVGIGTSNPTSKLQISTPAIGLDGMAITALTNTLATTSIGAKLSFTGGSNTNNNILGGISMGNTGEEFAGMYAMDGGSGGATHLGLFVGTSSAITEGIRILSNGAVGIGSTSVNSGIKLQVAGGIYPTVGYVYAKFFRADYFSSGQNAEIQSGGSGKVQLRTSNNVQLEANSGGFVKLSHVGSTSGGKFLVRTYSGDDYLNVFSSEHSSGALCIGYGAAGKYNASGFVSTYDNFAGHKTLLKINHNGFNVLTTSTNQTDTVGADLMMTNRFTVQNDKAYFGTGNVGIGNTNPSQKLSVTGNISLSGVVLFNDNNGINFGNSNAKIYGSSSDGIKFNAGNAEAMRLTQAGQLGIGVNNPNDYYYHQLVVGETTSGDKGITIRSSNAAKGVLAFADSDSGTDRYSGYIAYNHSTNDMEFYTLAGNFAMMIDDGQRVGIGTTSPNYTLDVEKAGGGMRVYNTTNNGDTDIHLRTAGTTGNSRIFFGDSADSDVGSIIYRHNGNSLAFETNDAEAVRIDSSGQVGIGTTSPQQELEVDGVIKQKVYTVSSLPSASTSTIGARAFVSNSYYPATSSYLGTMLSGSSGSYFAPVYSDGSYWYLG